MLVLKLIQNRAKITKSKTLKETPVVLFGPPIT